MKEFNFKRMTLSERQARLRYVINGKTKGMISNFYVQQIVDNINLKLQYKIKIMRTSESMKRELTLQNKWWRNKCCHVDSEGVKETAEILVGSCKFGIDCWIEKSENGNVVDTEKVKKEPEFDESHTLVITKYINEWQKVYGDGRNYGRRKNILVIYIPKKTLKKIS